MQAIKDWANRTDFDELLSYSSIKLILIRDRYLGFLHHAFQLGIFIYVIIFVIIINKGYMRYDVPTGSVQYTVRRVGQKRLFDFLFVANHLRQCVDECPDIEFNKLAYCTEPQVGNGNQIDGCRLWDEFQAVVGLEATAFYAITRVTDTLQRRDSTCGDVIFKGNERCGRIWHDMNNTELTAWQESKKVNGSIVPSSFEWVAEKNPTTYYTTEVDQFSLKFSHNVNALQFLETRPDSQSLQGVNEEMDGKLYFLNSDDDGNIISFIGDEDKVRDLPKGELNAVTISELMTAAGMEAPASGGILDSKSDISDNSKRYDGIVLLMVFTYRNDYPSFVATGVARYDIKVFRVKNAEFKYEFMIPLDQGRTRIRRNTHGVRLLYLQQGRLGRFSFQVLLVQLVSALALLKLAATIVDLLMLYALNHRSYYRDYKYQVTRDFSDLRADEKKQKEELRRGSHPDSHDESARNAEMKLDQELVAQEEGALNEQNVVNDGDDDGTEDIPLKTTSKRKGKKKSIVDNVDDEEEEK